MKETEPALIQIGEWVKDYLKRKSEVSKVPAEYRPYLPDTSRKDGRLRQADLAALLGVSSSRMSEILNGKYLNLTEKKLREIIDILQMPLAEERHLLDLYHNYDPAPYFSTSEIEDMARSPRMENLLSQLEPLPAMLCNQMLDILAWNSVARAMLVDFEALRRQKPEELNIVRQMFGNPDMRDRFLDWDNTAAELVAALRKETSHFTDPHSVRCFRELIRDMRARSATFGELWDDPEVRLGPPSVKGYRHPDPAIGTLLIDQWATDIIGFDGRLTLIVFVPQDGSNTAEGFRRLMALTKLEAIPG